MSPPTIVPFNRPSAVGDEVRNIAASIASGSLAGGGHFARLAERALAQVVGSHVLLTTSCTHALEMAAILLNLREGDEVVVPSFAFPSCANAFVLRGATPVFVDVDPTTFSIDPMAVDAAITERTRAVLVIHYGGVACDLDALASVVAARDIAVVEDNAHGLFGFYNGRPLGSFGRFSTMSFHETKNVQCGEGGALALNRQSDVARAEIVREKGTNRSAFFRGAVAKYQWVDLGSSYVIGEMLAAFLCGQLEKAADLQARRALLWRRYHDGLEHAVAVLGWRRPTVPAYATSAHHLYFLVAESEERRAEFIAFLAVRGIHSAFHYQALHRSPFALERGYDRASCPNADVASERLVRLPLYAALSDSDQERVIEAVEAFAGL